MPDYRVAIRGHSTYHTRTNIWRKVRTPGNRLSTLKVARRPLATKCAFNGQRLHGLQRVNPTTVSRCARTVSRPYGGVLSMQAVRDRILRAFLVEESKAAARAAKEKANKHNAKK